MKCPNCDRPLDQMGEAKDGVFYGENLYRCQDCPYGKNRFTILNGKAIPVEVSHS